MAEAERKAQQEKLYYLDIERILGGVWAWLWALAQPAFAMLVAVLAMHRHVSGVTASQKSGKECALLTLKGTVCTRSGRVSLEWFAEVRLHWLPLACKLPCL